VPKFCTKLKKKKWKRELPAPSPDPRGILQQELQTRAFRPTARPARDFAKNKKIKKQKKMETRASRAIARPARDFATRIANASFSRRGPTRSGFCEKQKIKKQKKKWKRELLAPRPDPRGILQKKKKNLNKKK
jgi:hypothetical protein